MVERDVKYFFLPFYSIECAQGGVLKNGYTYFLKYKNKLQRINIQIDRYKNTNTRTFVIEIKQQQLPRKRWQRKRLIL